MRGFVVAIVLLVLAVASVLVLRLLHAEHVGTEALKRRDDALLAEMKARACLRGVDDTCDVTSMVRKTAWGEFARREVVARVGDIEVGFYEDTFHGPGERLSKVIRPLSLAGRPRSR